MSVSVSVSVPVSVSVSVCVLCVCVVCVCAGYVLRHQRQYAWHLNGSRSMDMIFIPHPHTLVA